MKGIKTKERKVFQMFLFIILYVIFEKITTTKWFKR